MRQLRTKRRQYVPGRGPIGAIWLDPKPFVLERVGRQTEGSATARFDYLPADRPPLPIESTEGSEEAGPIAVRFGQRRKPDAALRRASATEGDEGRGRADLEERIRSRRRRLDRLAKANRMANLIAPVAGVRRCHHLSASKGRDPANFWRGKRDAGRRRGERVEHRLHQRRMKGVR